MVGGLDEQEVRTMVQWLFAVSFNKPPSIEETDMWVRSMFMTVDTDNSGTLEHDELLMCYVSSPLITQCFESIPEMSMPRSKSSVSASLEQKPSSQPPHRVDKKDQQGGLAACACYVS